MHMRCAEIKLSIPNLFQHQLAFNDTFLSRDGATLTIDPAICRFLSFRSHHVHNQYLRKEPLLAGGKEKFSESAPKFNVEDGVDDRVEEAVHVARPDEEREQDRVDVAERCVVEEIITDADGVDDGNGEEGNPASQEDSWKHT